MKISAAQPVFKREHFSVMRGIVHRCVRQLQLKHAFMFARASRVDAFVLPFLVENPRQFVSNEQFHDETFSFVVSGYLHD